jgi:hypothetical protein
MVDGLASMVNTAIRLRRCFGRLRQSFSVGARTSRQLSMANRHCEPSIGHNKRSPNA